MKALDSVGRSVLHPFLSRNLDDRLSLLLIRSATSLAWNIVALGALLATLALLLPLRSQHEVGSSLVEKLLILYSVVGVVWNALAANAHSAKAGHYGRGLLLFAFWPLSFPYNWREAVRLRGRLGSTVTGQGHD